MLIWNGYRSVVLRLDWRRLLPYFPFTLFALVFAILSFRSPNLWNPDAPMTKQDMQTVLGCYTNGATVVRVEPDTVAATNGTQSIRSTVAKFRYFHLFGVSTDVELTRINETDKVNIAKSPYPLNYVFEGSERNRFLAVPSNAFDKDGESRTVKLYRRPC